MSLPSPRYSARPPRRAIEAPSRAVLSDARFGPLSYLHGWWYGTADFFEFGAVRIRLPGDLGGPMPGARAALIGIERCQHALLRQIHPYLWAAYLAAREARQVRATRSRVRNEVPGAILRERCRLDAACANAYGEDGLVELALEPCWTPGRVLGAYVRDNTLVEFRGSIGLWRTPL